MDKKTRSDMKKEAKRQVKKRRKRYLTTTQCAEVLLRVLRKNRKRYDDGALFGFYWDESIKDYRQRRNKRRIDLVDAEHFLCKAYICYIQTTASRYLSEMPDFAKPYCHPHSRRHPIWKATPGSPRYQLMLELLRIVERYEQLCSSRKLAIQVPDFARYDNELGKDLFV